MIGLFSRYAAATVSLPLASVGIAAWGSTWGWNADGKLISEIVWYLLASYLLFAVPELALEVTHQKWAIAKRVGFLRREGLKTVVWGVFVISVSIALIQSFYSAALWLGTMSDFYIGFLSILYGVIRALSA